MNEAPQNLILIHGLWFGPWAMGIFKRHLSAAGFNVRRFRYSTTRGAFDDNARELARRIRCLPPGPVGLVGHSMGGLLALQALAHVPARHGRLVLMGSPLKGSRVARRIHQWPGGDKMLGEAARVLKRGASSPPPTGWEVGMIAGSKRLGAGMLAGAAGHAGDGTVTLEETRAGYLLDHVVLPESHTSMLLSGDVAAAAVSFLRGARFQGKPQAAPDDPI